MFEKPLVYPIVDADECQRRGIEPFRLAEACLRGGARVLQVRWKRPPGGAFLELARRVVSAAAACNATVVINDRWDIARLGGAAGVHVGQDDLDVAAIHAVAPDLAVGRSTHDTGQVDDALHSAATYVAVGPIYGTATKDTGYTPRGLDLIRYAAGRGKPIVAIGGITVQRVPELIRSGATGLAVISDVLDADRPEERVRAYVEACEANAP